MKMPSVNEVKKYARTLKYIMYPEFVNVSVKGKTLKVYTPESPFAAPYDIGLHFSDENTYTMYKNYTVTIKYD